MRSLFQSWLKWHSALAPNEKWWIWFICAILILATTLPYIYGALVTPTGHDFQGVHRLSIDDTYVYYSYINQIQQGQWLLFDLMTSESQQHGLFNVVWLVIGRIGARLHLGSIASFHVARIALIVPAIWAIYYTITHFLSRPRERLASLWLATCSGGFGWMFAPLINHLLQDAPRDPMYFWPIDLWQTEAFVFNILFQSPHFILSLSLLLLVVVGISQSLRQQSWRPVALTSILILVWLNFHPYYAPLILGVLAVYTILHCLHRQRINWRVIGRVAILMTATLPMIIYHRLVLLWEPILATRATQNITMTGHWSSVVIGYGALWVIAIIGIWLWYQRKFTIANHIILISWTATTLFLMLYPTQFQRRFFQGGIVIMAILAGPAVVWIWDRFANSKSRRVMITIFSIVSFCGSPISLIAQDLHSYRQLTRNNMNPDYGHVTYTPTTDALIWDHLNQLPPFTAVILAYPYTALRISAATRQHSYIAHGHETVDIKQKLKMANEYFFTDANPDNLLVFLRNEKIDYIYWGVLEQKHSHIKPDELPFLFAVVRTPAATLYRVQP